MPQTQIFRCIDVNHLILQYSTHEVDAGMQGCSGSSKPKHWLNKNGGEQSPPFFLSKQNSAGDKIIFIANQHG